MNFFQQNKPPSASPAGSAVFIAGLLLAFFTIDNQAAPYDVVNKVAIITGVSLAISILADTTRGFRSLIRVDLLCLLALYTLAFLEFLFPQPTFEETAAIHETVGATRLMLLGFIGIALGRHFIKPSAQRVLLEMPDIPPKLMILGFWGFIALGSLHMWLAVDFNPIRIYESLMDSRWNVPWARGRYGGWKDLLNEFSLLFYIIPPLTGMAFANRKKYTKGQLIGIVIGFSFIIFIAICSGTRSTLGAHAATFTSAYLISFPKVTIKRVAIFGAVVFSFTFFCFYHMLEFRNMGLKRYLELREYAQVNNQEVLETRDTLFIDYNVFNLGKLYSVFPEQYDYLGWEVPWIAITKPIPRAIWKSKPEGLTVSIEEAMGVEGMTIAVTFVGEAYMAGGPFVVFIVALMVGMFSTVWNRLAGLTSSNYGLVVYATGAFAGAICMRSMLFITTCTLPVVALLVLAMYLKRLGIGFNKNKEVLNA